jgi:hypothetical protein
MDTYYEFCLFYYLFPEAAIDGKRETLKLVEEIEEGNYQPYLPDNLLQGLRCEAEPKHGQTIQLFIRYEMTIVDLNAERNRFDHVYLAEGIIPAKLLTIAFDIILGLKSNIDFTVSFIFMHILKHKTIPISYEIKIREGDR